MSVAAGSPAKEQSTGRIFLLSGIITVIALVVAFIYGSWTAVGLAAILGILEITLSFDNAVVNATVLQKMNEQWQRIFLTVGVIIAVVGMRLVFPLLIVGLTAHLNPVEAVRLALEKGNPDTPGTYGYLLNLAHPQIAAFGGMFLLLLFLDWTFEERDITWLSWLEKPLAKIGKLDQLAVIIAGVVLAVVSQTLADDPGKVLFAGVLGIVSYIAVNGLGTFFETEDGEEPKGGPSQLVKVAGRAAFFLFLYLEVLDASFSFDGVIGAFAITADPILIALGLGLIGSMFVRSLTVYLVRKGTLSEYVYLEHGAHWAIGALSVILLVSIGVHVNEIVTGLVGLVLIGAALISSIIRNRRDTPDALTASEMPAGVPS